jgi:hypothetical protein
MQRLLILFVISAAGAVAACGPGSTSSPSLLAPDASAAPTEAPSMDDSSGSSEAPAMSAEPSSSP